MKKRIIDSSLIMCFIFITSLVLATTTYSQQSEKREVLYEEIKELNRSVSSLCEVSLKKIKILNKINEYLFDQETQKELNQITSVLENNLKEIKNEIKKQELNLPKLTDEELLNLVYILEDAKEYLKKLLEEINKRFEFILNNLTQKQRVIAVVLFLNLSTSKKRKKFILDIK